MIDTHTKSDSSQESFPPAQKSMPPAIKVMNFETALNELQSIVSKLEKGEIQLEDALNLYERASFLRTHCENKLHDAQLKVEKFKENNSTNSKAAASSDYFNINDLTNTNDIPF